MLQHIPACSFQDLCVINGIIHPTFQDAAIAAGLFADFNKAQYTIQEAIEALTIPRQLCFLFVDLLLNDCIPLPIQIWTSFHLNFCQDFMLRSGTEVGENLTLMDIQCYLNEHGKTLNDYSLPEVHSLVAEVEHELI